MMIGIGGRQTDRQTDRDRDREGVRATKYATGTVNVVRSCKSNRRTGSLSHNSLIGLYYYAVTYTHSDFTKTNLRINISKKTIKKTTKKTLRRTSKKEDLVRCSIRKIKPTSRSPIWERVLFLCLQRSSYFNPSGFSLCFLLFSPHLCFSSLNALFLTKTWLVTTRST
ncbi:hypothetical protein ACN38_g3817 [Penicillium nordicum]|uniref:Uncharacterized protein n=1 Tax=Penicillium nordicum TaxID=229535 RepID=A0A0M9WHN9_9EURO|nr:hypothetical protein ACN38_g3817 [Penicillium nordicum]